MDVKETKTFQFNHPVNGVNYGFSIQADTKDSACNQLLLAMEQIAGELKSMLKAGTKPN